MHKAANLTGTNLSQYVDEITYSSGSSWFDLIGGKRILNIRSETFRKTRAGQLIDALHKITHAQKWHHTLKYRFKGDFGKAFQDFFMNKPFGSAEYAFDEVIAERLALRSV